MRVVHPRHVRLRITSSFHFFYFHKLSKSRCAGNITNPLTTVSYLAVELFPYVIFSNPKPENLFTYISYKKQLYRIEKINNKVNDSSTPATMDLGQTDNKERTKPHCHKYTHEMETPRAGKIEC